jgi:hypothetical protein
MYLIVAAQLGVLATIIAPQELNRALDSGPTVDVEIAQARVGRDNFRGAYVYGQSALDLDARGASLPAGLRAGERVLVSFAVEPNRRPRISSVERGRRGAPFTPTSFTLPGRVLDERGGGRYVRHDGLIARVGTPSVAIALDLPSSIAVDDAAVTRLSGPSLVRASLHAGYLGHPYFTDVRLTGRGWPSDMRFVWDDARERLLVFAPREAMTYVSGGGRTPTPSDLFVFDAAGKELSNRDIQGYVLDATVDAEGQVLALMTSQRWNHSEVSVVRLDEDGRAGERSPPIALDRVLGFDVGSQGVWVLAGPVSSPRKPPYFVQRLTVTGLREPKLGPFESVPRAVVSAGNEAWVVENERHRITRWDASGRQTREYRDLNGPLEIAVDAGGAYVIEASRTQLTRLTEDGRVAWRVPRFQALTWAIAESGGGGIVAASTFEGAQAGLLKVSADGAISPLPATARPQPRNDWQRHVGSGVVRSVRDGRLLFIENEAIAILSADGTTLTRVVGFRLPTEQRLRS